MRHKRFLYFLCEADGRFLTVKNGIVTSTTVPTSLKHTPDGWQALTLAWERDMKMLGLVRQLSLPFGFISDAAFILRKAFYKESIERKIYLVITKLDMQVDMTAQTFDPLYKIIYKGEIDNTSLKDSELKIEASINEGGLQKLLTANRATVYEYPLSEGDCKVKLDGINLYQTGNYLIPGSDTQYRQNHFLDVSFLNRDGEGTGIAFLTEQGGQIPFGYNYNTGDNYFMVTTDAITGLRLQGTVRMRPNHTDGHYTLFLERTSTGVVNIATISNPSGIVEIPIDLTINTIAGEKFYLGANRVSSGSGLVSYYETTLTVSVHSRYHTSYAQGYTPLALYKRLIKSIAGKEDYAFSNLLAQYNHIKLTSGDGLRSIEGANIKTSLNDFFEFCYVQMFAGLGPENGKIVIEDRGHFLDTANPIELGEVKDLKVEEATDLLFNTVKVGYQPVQTDDVNGKYAFNNSYTFSVAQTKVTKELTLICPYIADPYAIELTRINLEGKTTTDSGKDNQIFLLDAPNKTKTKTVSSEVVFGVNAIYFTDKDDLDGLKAGDVITISNAGLLNGTYTILTVQETTGTLLTVHEPVPLGTFIDAIVTFSICELYRNPLMTITGVPDPETIFNIRLSPKRILLKWLVWINSVLYREAGTKLTYVTTDKNADLKTVEGGVTIEEKANVTLTASKLFINKYFSFENIVPQNLHKLLADNPNRPFAWYWLGVRYTGFQRKTGLAPSDEKEQTFKMLSSPDNDFKDLNHG